jgi:Holliday junction DNA helicase RuvA
MIGRLHGLLIYKQPPDVMLEVNGVGYELQAPMSTFYQLPECGQSVILFTHMVVREDAQSLYGFNSTSDRSLFRTLLKVNGVGAKMALAILSGMDAQGFKQCIQFGDTDALIRLPGVGKKTAERLIVELKDRLGDESNQLAGDLSSGSTQAGERNHIEEAVSALTALGYKGPEALRMVKKVTEDTSSCEDLIRLALKTSLN